MEHKYHKYFETFNPTEYFKKQKRIKKYFDFFQLFFKKENLLQLIEKEAKTNREEDYNWSNDIIWKEIVKVREHIYSFLNPAFSGKRALGGWPNHPVIRYLNFFYYLKHGEEAKYTRISNILNRVEEKSLRGFGFSSLSELVSQAFPNEFVFYNKRNKEAIKFLGIDLKIPGGFSDAEEFFMYNNSIDDLVTQYKMYFYESKTKEFFQKSENFISKTCLTHEVDQFLNWIYDTKIYTSSKSINEPIGKVSKIILNSYNTFEKGLKIDLTYPKGIEKIYPKKKEGQPLDKVCIIGQSGTGKTTLLNLIKNFTFLKNTGKEVSKVLSNNVTIEYSYNNIKLEVTPDENNILLCKAQNKRRKTNLNKYVSVPRLVNFPANSVENIKNIIEEEHPSETANINLDNLIDFSEQGLSNRIWKKLLLEIKDYKKEILKISLEIREQLGTADLSEELNKLAKKIQELNKKGGNPLLKFANFVDPILVDFNLKIKTEIDQNSIDNFGFIEVQHINGNDVNFDNSKISLGTQQILEKTASLYNIAPYNSIILIDEPENSLYPDVQKKFIEFLVEENWTKNEIEEENEKSCQFFFATHSPTIASVFEPWEIIELKINENTGEVYVENYLKNSKKGRHVDNYKFYPKYLRWDSILTEIFDIEEGNEERLKELDSLAYLDEKIKYLKKNDKQQELEQAVKKYKELADKLAWKINKK